MREMHNAYLCYAIGMGGKIPLCNAVRATQHAKSHPAGSGYAPCCAITYQIPDTIRARGGKIVEINPNASSITPHADVWLEGGAAVVLPRLLEQLGV
jgi:hypothetical protein